MQGQIKTKRGILMKNYTHGDVLLLSNRALNRERMIIRKGNEYYPLDVYTGNVVDIAISYEKFFSADEVVDAYRKKGYKVEVKPK